MIGIDDVIGKESHIPVYFGIRLVRGFVVFDPVDS